MSQKKIEEEHLKIKNLFYDYKQKRFSDSDSNFLKYINDSSRTLEEFVGFVKDHIEVFNDIISQFKMFIDKGIDDNGKSQMELRIQELKSTIKMLEYVLNDIKTNPLGKRKE